MQDKKLYSIVNRMDQVVHWTQSGPNGILYETDSGIQKDEDGRKNMQDGGMKLYCSLCKF